MSDSNAALQPEPRFELASDAPRLDLTPLIDVVFVLLTFFLLLPAVRGDPLTALDITLPAIGAEGAPPGDPVQVRLDQGGAILVDGERTEPADLGPSIRAAQGSNDEARGVILIADERGDRASLLALLDAMARSGIDDFAIVGAPLPDPIDDLDDSSDGIGDER